jgi:hypothetical protein
MKHKTLFKRAQNVKTLGHYVMVVVTVDGMRDFSPERKQFARDKMNSLFISLSNHPDYVGCFDKGLTMFNDDCFGICCNEEYADGLKKTIDRFIKSFNFDLIISCGRFETMSYANCDSELYGGDLYEILRKAHKFCGIGKKFFKRVQGKH